MAIFLEGDNLNAKLGELFQRAEYNLILISPFIKLHDRLRDILKLKMDRDEFFLTVVFGKNKDDLSRSISIDDLEFLKKFPNVEIRYEERLHAKYYANDEGAILTSLNLLDGSQNKNIEAGVYMKAKSILSQDKLDADAWEYFETVVYNSKLLFKRVPEYTSGMLGLGKRYIKSNTEIDELNAVFGGEAFNTTNYNYRSNSRSSQLHTGYCIRTGVKIPFNPSRPLCDEAYNIWKEYQNYDYPEKYCHKTGRAANGRTSYRHPIL